MSPTDLSARYTIAPPTPQTQGLITAIHEAHAIAVKAIDIAFRTPNHPTKQLGRFNAVRDAIMHFAKAINDACPDGAHKDAAFGHLDMAQFAALDALNDATVGRELGQQFRQSMLGAKWRAMSAITGPNVGGDGAVGQLAQQVEGALQTLAQDFEVRFTATSDKVQGAVDAAKAATSAAQRATVALEGVRESINGLRSRIETLEPVTLDPADMTPANGTAKA